jgi:arginine decarboxylase
VIVKGTGKGETPLAAFDAALSDAGISEYNLLYLSSVIPPNSTVECRNFDTPPEEYGSRLYVVLARGDAEETGVEAWAGLGWVQDENTGQGFFVEHCGSTLEQVDRLIQESTRSMLSMRAYKKFSKQQEVVGMKCRGLPVCAVVVAVFGSEGWDE